MQWTVKPESRQNLPYGRGRSRRDKNKQAEWPQRGYLLGKTGNGVVLRVVYSDESGVGDIKKEPLTVVAAIVINMDRDWDAVDHDLNFLRIHAPDALLEPKRVLKGKKIYGLLRKNAEVQQKRREVSDDVARQIAKEAHEATEFLHKIFAVLIKYRIPIFYGAVDRQGLIDYQEQPTLAAEDKEPTLTILHLPSVWGGLIQPRGHLLANAFCGSPIVVTKSGNRLLDPA